MARLDGEGEQSQLSWYVSETARGQGVGARLVREMLAQTPGPVRAEIKPDNLGSIRVAEAAGFRLQGLRDGVLHFLSEPIAAPEALPG
jgi:RimJ/RimL family protein N-acetyltransferase